MSQPNIVIICSDQHRADSMGCAGHPQCRTPNLDRLASRGVMLERCFSQNPVCGPARACMMTGCGNHRNGVYRNGYACSRALPSMADILGGQGYRTAAFGKLHLMPHQAGIAKAPHYGFEHLEGVEDNSLGPYFDWICERWPEYREYVTGCLFNLPENPDYWRGKHDLRPDVLPARKRSVERHEISETCNWGYAHYSPLPEPAHKSAWITDRVLAYLEGHDPADPLLMWVGYVDPHNPFDPPERFRRMYAADTVPPRIRREGEEADFPPQTSAMYGALSGFTESDWRMQRALYYGGITFMDHHIGRLLEGLEAKLDMSNTIVVYLSDHGELLGDRGLLGKQAYHYDGCIRVPMICRWDGHWPAGERRMDIVEQTDLLATLLDACAIKGPPMDGRSFAPLVAGEAGEATRGYAYVESYHGGPCDPTPPPGTWARTIRSDRYRVTFYPDIEVGECFDLEEDPEEVYNRWRDPAMRSVIEEHRKLLMQRLIMRDFPLPERPYDV